MCILFRGESSGDDGDSWSHLPHLDKMLQMMKTVPLEEAKIDKIMDEKSLETLKMWWKNRRHFRPSLIRSWKWL